MTRAEAAAFIGDRYSKYLDAVSRTAADDAANLKPSLDDALLAMGYTRAELATAEPAEADDEGFIAQAEYHVLRTIVRDLGAESFDVGLSGNSFRLEQIWKHAKEDLADARNNVLAIFGSVTAPDPTAGIVTLDLNYLDDCEAAVS